MSRRTNCANLREYRAATSPTSILTSGRFDFNVTNNDKIFIRLQEDVGTQATATDALTRFSTQSALSLNIRDRSAGIVPIGAKAVNNLLFAMQYYRAIFVRPTSTRRWRRSRPRWSSATDRLTTVGGDDFVWPQGRNVTGYQVVDDYSYSLAASTP